MARNPKDAMVSGWDFYRKMELLKLDGLELGTFFQATLCDKGKICISHLYVLYIPIHILWCRSY